MSTEPFIGEIKIFGFDFAPKGHLNCSGQLMPIRQYTALFSLLGTTYGGDGINTFALPDLRGRAAINQGQAPGLSNYRMGERGGTTNVTLLTANMPAHIHGLASARVQLNANSGIADESSPEGNYLAAPSTSIYSGNGGTPGVFVSGAQMSGTTDIAGSNTPVSIQNPYLTVNFCVATQGIFPSRP